MELSDIILTLVGIASTISIGVFRWIVKELNKIDDKIEAKLDKIIDALGEK